MLGPPRGRAPQFENHGTMVCSSCSITGFVFQCFLLVKKVKSINGIVVKQHLETAVCNAAVLLAELLNDLDWDLMVPQNVHQLACNLCKSWHGFLSALNYMSFSCQGFLSSIPKGKLKFTSTAPSRGGSKQTFTVDGDKLIFPFFCCASYEIKGQ